MSKDQDVPQDKQCQLFYVISGVTDKEQQLKKPNNWFDFDLIFTTEKHQMTKNPHNMNWCILNTLFQCEIILTLKFEPRFEESYSLDVSVVIVS